MRLQQSTKLQQALASAEVLVVAREGDCIQTQHLLIELLANRRFASRVLYARLKLPLKRVIDTCLNIEHRGFIDPKRPKPTSAKLSVRSQEIIETATRIAMEQGYGKVTTAHVLVACVTVDCFAKTILRQSGAKLEALRELLTHPEVLAAE